MKLRKSWAVPLVAMLVTFALLALVGFGGDRVVVAMTNMESDPSQVLFPALQILRPEFAPARQ